MSYLQNVCTISAILYFASLAEVDYFDLLTAVLAHFLCSCAQTA